VINRSTYWTHHGVSQSQLKELERSPFHYHKRFVAKEVPAVPKRTLRKGRALHAMVFEPDDFGERFPTFIGERRSKDDKERFASLEANAEALDGCIIRESEIEDVTGMAAALRSDRYIAALLRRVFSAELPIEWECPTTGIVCKARLDALAQIHSAGDTLVDLKTCTDASPRAFTRSIANLGYDLQAAHYLAGVEARTGTRPTRYLIVVVESAPPYAVAHYELAPAWIAPAEERRIRLLDRLAECRAKNEWPSYTAGFESIEPPAWRMGGM
jgi:hypothetical protein